MVGIPFEILMQVTERIRQSATCLEINYFYRSAFSFVMAWLGIGIFLISHGCLWLWFTSTQMRTGIQLNCERALPSEVDCRLETLTLVERRSQELRQLQTAQLRQQGMEEQYQLVLILASGEVIAIDDHNRASLEAVVNQVNDFIRTSSDRTLNTSYDTRWNVIPLVGFGLLWLIVVLLLFPVPLFAVDFRYICVFDKARNQATRLECALLEKRQETWQLDRIQAVQLDEEHTSDGTLYHIMLVLSSEERTSLLSWQQLPMPRAQFVETSDRIRQFLNIDS
ncbi:hypothetical protein LEP3755_16950 [Leptolyngbya sp. NIES-3755]|nr:hypothetical protein LEP3755_16950 [Leptolyngbya sp. NIES-3755]